MSEPIDDHLREQIEKGGSATHPNASTAVKAGMAKLRLDERYSRRTLRLSVITLAVAVAAVLVTALGYFLGPRSASSFSMQVNGSNLYVQDRRTGEVVQYSVVDGGMVQVRYLPDGIEVRQVPMKRVTESELVRQE